MKRVTNRLNKVLSTLLTIVALAMGQQANAECSFYIYGPTVSGNKASFRIERRGEFSDVYTQTVYYRTVNITAFAGQHYTAVSGQLEFGPNDNTKYVNVEELTPTNNAYIYQKDMTERSYKLEVTDLMGIPLHELVRTITNSGTSVNTSTAYDPQSYTIYSSRFLVTDKGFDKNTYKTLSSNDFFTAAAVPQGYLTTAGSEVRATFGFDIFEMEDGYQHFQVLVDNTSTCDTDNNNVNCGTPNKSRYLVSMAHVPGTLDDTPKNYTFPLTQYGDFTDPVDNPWGPRPGWPSKVYSQKFKSGCRASDGRLILPNTFSTLVVRFDASGNNADDYYVGNITTDMQNVDEYAPRQIAIAANPGRHARRNPFYVSVAFNEVITITETPTLTTNWGTLDYVAGDNTNVLTFEGRIPDNAPGSLIVNGITGAIEDLAGNTMTGGITGAGIASLDADLTYTLNDFKRDSQGNYLILTHDDLHGLASYTKTYTTSGLSFLQMCDINIPFMDNGDYYNDFRDNNYTEDNFYGIGYPYPFQGTYDGGGYEIYRLRMHKAIDRNVGLFRQIGQGGLVHNLHLGTSYIAGYENVGGIAGYVEGGTIEDCTVSSCYLRALQESANTFGGIAGLMTGTNATIQRCVSKVNIAYASGLSNCCKFGGIVGSAGPNTIVADNIASEATIPGVKARGAIAGYQSDATFTNNYYQSCKVAGTSNASNVGIGTNGSTTSADQDGARRVYAITLADHTAFDRTLSAILPSIGSTYRTYNNGAKIGSQHYIYATAPIHLTYDSSNIEEGNAFAMTITRTSNGNAVDFTDNDDYTYDFIMPAADVTVATTQGPGIYYIDADGKERWLFLSDCQEIYPLVGTLVYRGQEKWFYVKPGVYSFDVDINIIAGQANIIFCDGVVATFSRQPQGIYNYELKDGGDDGGGIAIYGQREGNAKINIQDGQGGKIEALGDIDIYSGEITVKDFSFRYALYSHTGDVNIHGGNVTIYNTYCGTCSRNVNIYGGTVNAICGEEVWSTSAIYARGNVNILGGQVTAIGEGNVPGIQAGFSGDKTITLSWTNYSDRITSNGYVCGNINVQDGQTLYDGNVLYSGDITSSSNDIKEKTLIPYIANATADDGTGILYDKDAGLPEGHRNADRIAALTSGTSNDLAILGRTLYKDGAWNTLCLPIGLSSFGSTPLEDATVMTLGNNAGCNTGFDSSTGILTLDFVPAYTIEPGVAYIMKWDGDGTDNIVTPVFSGITISNESPEDQKVVSTDQKVQFKGTYEPINFNATDKSILFMGASNTLHYPGNGASIGAFRSYFQVNLGGNEIKQFNLSFGEDDPTGINSLTLALSSREGEIYNLAGQRINKMQKGINIVNGKKILK